MLSRFTADEQIFEEIAAIAQLFDGKVERFWRTLDEDVIEGTTFDNLDRFANELFEYLVYYNRASQHPFVYVIEENRLC